MKHNLFSRFISVLLAVVMLAGLMSMPSLADTVTGTDTAATDNVNITEDDTEVSSAPAALSEEGTEGDKEPADSNESSEPTDDAETTGDVQEPEEGTEDTQEPADTTGDTVGTDDTQEPADTTEGNGDEEIVGDTQNENAGQEPAGSTESTEAAQSDSEPQDIDNEGTPSESAFDCEAFYDKLMNAQTPEELESLTSGLSDEDIASFQQWLDDDKMAALEEKEAQFSSTDAADDSQPAPAVNYDKVAPISAATAAAASATGALKARARTFSLTSDTLSGSTDSGTGDTSNLVLEKRAESVGNNNTYKITLDAYTKGTVTAGTAPAYDIVLVLDMSTSMKDPFYSYSSVYDLSENRTYYVKTANGSYDEVKWCKDCKSWTHGCHDEGALWWEKHVPGTSYTPKTSATDTDTGHAQFYRFEKTTRLDALKTAAKTFVSNVAAQEGDSRIAIVGFHDDAMTLADLQNADQNKQKLLNAINGISDLDYATEHGKGLEQAKNVFDDAGNTGHKRLVVMITDGEPEPQGSSQWSSRIVKQAINNAYDLKNDYNAAVYTVSVMPGTDAQGDSAMDRYMSYVSSNYPQAQYRENATDSTNENIIVNQITPGLEADLEDGKSFYLTAGDVETLNSIFDQIGDQIETPSISLDENTVIQDAVTQYFNMPATSDVTVQKIPYNGSAFVDISAETITDEVTVQIEGNKVKVNGFDFDENFVSTTEKKDGTHGYMLRITFNVTPKDEFWGGNQVPTNVPDDSGVYTGTGTLVKNFGDKPTVDVPLKPIELTDKKLNIYCGNEAPELSQMVDGVNWPTGDDSWQVDFVEIEYATNGTIDTKEDGSYQVTATLSPKKEGSITENKTDTATANLYVYKPTVTWKDTTQNAGSAVAPAENNYVSTVWKHDQTLSTQVEMFGKKPTLSFTFQKEDGAQLPATLNGTLNVKVDTVTNGGTNIKAKTTFEWAENKDSTGCLNCVNPNPGYQFRIHDTSNEYPVRFYLEGVQNNAGASNYAFEDDWAILDSVYAGGYVALPDANTCVYNNDLVVPNDKHDAADVITGNVAVSAWLNKNNANPKNLTVGSIKEVLQALVDDGRLTEDAQLVSVGDTKYTVKEVLEQPQDFELVYTQVAENTDVIQEYKRGNRFSDTQQQSYHVHLTVKYKPGNMTITKTFSGVDSLPENFALNVKLGDTTVETLGLADAAGYNEATKTYTWNLEDLNGGNYTVEETNFDVTDMVLDATFDVTPQGGTTQTTTDGYSAAVPVEMNKTTSVAITNTYTDAKGDLTIQKSVVLSNGLSEVPDRLKDTVFLFQVSGPDDFSTIVSIQCNGQSAYQGSVTLTDLPVGNYTITELPSLGFVCNQQVQAETVVGGTAKTVTFTNTCDGDEWGDKENLPNTFTYNATDSTWHYNNNK